MDIAIARERFWSRVDVSGGPGACWPFNGTRQKRPGREYGAFTGNGIMHPAHRWGWIFTFADLPRWLLVCHRCDNPPCVNPAHLFLGTYSDNTLDCVAKGRHVGYRGSRHAWATLDESVVLQIRRMKRDGATNKSLAKMFSVGLKCIENIVYRRTWKYLTDEAAPCALNGGLQ